MEKKLKKKCIISVICTVIGVIIAIVPLYVKGLSEIQSTYINGFGTSFTVVCFVLFVKNVRSLKDPKTIRNREIELTDERNSMAITFRICILLQAILSIILVTFMNSELGMYLGLLVEIQLLVYVISSVIFSRKI